MWPFGPERRWPHPNGRRLGGDAPPAASRWGNGAHRTVRSKSPHALKTWAPPGREVPLPGVVSYRTSPQRIYFTPRRATAKSAPISATRATRHAPNAAVSKRAAWGARGLRHRKTERGGSAAAQAADLCRSGPRAVPQRTAARNRRADRAGDDVTPAMMMPAFPADRAQRRAESERRAPTLSDSGGASLRPERGREEGRKGGRVSE